jgi:hypothetical protein
MDTQEHVSRKQNVGVAGLIQARCGPGRAKALRYRDDGPAKAGHYRRVLIADHIGGDLEDQLAARIELEELRRRRRMDT